MLHLTEIHQHTPDDYSKRDMEHSGVQTEHTDDNNLVSQSTHLFCTFSTQNITQWKSLLLIFNCAPIRCFYKIRPKLIYVVNHRKRCFVIAQLQHLHLSSSFNRQLLDLNVLVSHDIPAILLLFEFHSFSTSRIDPKSNADYFSINNLFQTVNLAANMRDRGTPDKETMKCQIYPRVH